MKWVRQPQKLVEDKIIEDASSLSVAIQNPLDNRGSAVIDVLCALPEEEYERMRNHKVWFLAPSLAVNGWNGRFPQAKAQIIYLSPVLEENYTSQDRVLIAAHEIAHSLLAHTDTPTTSEKENEAWDKVHQLGFGTVEEIANLRSRMGAFDSCPGDGACSAGIVPSRV
jgi:hypothetical protein